MIHHHHHHPTTTTTTMPSPRSTPVAGAAAETSTLVAHALVDGRSPATTHVKLKDDLPSAPSLTGALPSVNPSSSSSPQVSRHHHPSSQQRQDPSRKAETAVTIIDDDGHDDDDDEEGKREYMNAKSIRRTTTSQPLLSAWNAALGKDGFSLRTLQTGGRRGPWGFESLFELIADIFESPIVVVCVYFLLNLTITLYNKIIMKLFNFRFPWLLTFIHALISCLGSSILVHGLKVVPVAKLSGRRDLIVILVFSILYTVNIAVSNVSLNKVSLPFHQVVRSTNPAVTLALEWLLVGKKVVNPQVYLSLTMVISGVALATLGEYEFSTVGFCLTLLGVVLSSLKGIFTHRLLVGSLKLHPLDLLWRMSGLAAVQCLLVSYTSGELAAYESFISKLRDSTIAATSDAASSAKTLVNGTFVMGLRVSPRSLMLALLINGILAFVLNFISFVANRKVGALSMAVAGNVKQSMTIALSVWIFGYLISTLNGIGIVFSLAGGAWYSSIGLRRRKPGVGTIANSASAT